MSFFVVVYTAAGLIGAVSQPLDLDRCASLTDQSIEWQGRSETKYRFECEERSKRPKVQTKIPDRWFLESYCRNVLDNVTSCADLPNGNLEFKGYRCTYVVTRKEIEYPHTPLRTVADTCGLKGKS